MRSGFAAPRRPRSGFRESSQEEALGDPRRPPRERSRKEKQVLGSSASSYNRRSRKKRGGLSEVQFAASDQEDGYETAGQLNHAASPSLSPSDYSHIEEEEPPALPRGSFNSKPKPHKVAEDTIIGAGLGSIPRKARSAFAKRGHESSSSVPPLSDGTGLQSCANAPSPTGNGFSTVSPSPAADPSRRTKQSGTKPRPAKLAKISATFSEREVEVAEVLFGFAKQITGAEEDANELKASSPTLSPARISSVVSSPVSASQSSLSRQAEAPKRKRIAKAEEIRSPATATVEQTFQSMEMECSPSKNADVLDGLMNGIGSVLPPTSNPIQVSNPTLSSVERNSELDRKTVTESVKIKESLIDPNIAEMDGMGIPEKVERISEPEGNRREADKIDSTSDVLHSASSATKFESPKMSPSSPNTENAATEKFEIDLMAPPEKGTPCLLNDKMPDVTAIAGATSPEEETVGIGSLLDAKAMTMEHVKKQEKKEEEVQEEETEKRDSKRDKGEEIAIEQQHVKEGDMEGKNHADTPKTDRITRTELRTQKPERPDISSPLVSATGNISNSASGAASLPMSMAITGWPGGLSNLGYFGPTTATWPGAPSLPGLVPAEGSSTQTIQPGFILQPRETLKRCATHAYIAHFIDWQQQMARHPFWAAAYGTPTALFGGKPYNLNIPLASSMGGSLTGSIPALNARNSNIMSSSFNDNNIGSAALASISGQNSKEKFAASYMDAFRKHTVHQQATQKTSSSTMQHVPSFGFPITESGASSSAAANTGNAGSLVNGRNSGAGPAPFHGGASSNLVGGTVTANSSLASMASAQAQYLAMVQQNGYPFPFTPAHFGSTNAGTHNHLGHQQIINSSFYAAHLLHPPQPQQQGQSNHNSPNGSSTQKHQPQFNFSSAQQQMPPQHHLFSSSQTSQVEHEGSNGGDSASTADRKVPLSQKSLYSQGSSSNSNSNANPSSLLVTTSPLHPQDLSLIAALGAKHTNKQQPQVSMQHHRADPNLQVSLKGQPQNAKQASGRAKTTAQSSLSGYADRATISPNSSKFQENSITSGQNPKQQQQGRHTPEWKVPSNMPIAAGPAYPSQAAIAAAMRSSSQQGRNQQVNSTLVANLPAGAIPQSVFATSTKNYGQQSRNQQNNSSSIATQNSKSVGTPTSKTASGNKGTMAQSHRSIAPISGKMSSPNHTSPSLSGKSSQQQYEQQQQQPTSAQSVASTGSGQAVGSKNQQYYSPAHFNQQQKQSLPQQIQQQLLFSQNQYLQQQVMDR